jgi:hypothetical protein
MMFFCYICGHETLTSVLDTRGYRRRRQCVECRGTFSTIEELTKQRRSPTRYPESPAMSAEIVAARADGLSFSQIGQKLQRPAGWVRARFRRASARHSE